MQAVVDCVRKSYVCHEAEPNYWEGIQTAGKALLTDVELALYRKLIPGDKDRQDEWYTVITDPPKYVSLLVGQQDDEEQRAERDEENYQDCSEWEETTQNYFLSYHELKAHL